MMNEKDKTMLIVMARPVLITSMLMLLVSNTAP